LFASERLIEVPPDIEAGVKALRGMDNEERSRTDEPPRGAEQLGHQFGAHFEMLVHDQADGCDGPQSWSLGGSSERLQCFLLISTDAE
jgi:hypothetical protein